MERTQSVVTPERFASGMTVNLIFAYRGHCRAGACPPPSVADNAG